MLFVLPITSMPIIARILGSSSVASPAILFLAFLVLIWFVPYIFKKGKIPSHSLPLLVFFCFALLSTCTAFFINIPPFKDFSIIKENISALASLVIGISFYLVTSLFPQDEEDITRAMRIINWGGLILLCWVAIQAISWFGFHRYSTWMFDYQGIFSSRVLYHNRVTGFALEPSWLAHQLNMLYLPIWLAATVKKFSSHSFRILGLSLENVLLFAGIIALILTLSRGGYIAFLCMTSIILIQLNEKLIKYLTGIWQNRRRKQQPSPHQTRVLTIILSLLLISAYIVTIFVGAIVLSKVDRRMKNIFDFSTNSNNPILSYFNDLQAGERAIYWLTGWQIFNDHPILGVGLGNAGFFFPEKIPAYGWTLVEVRRLAFHSDILLNIKNLWVRLLAETGVIGFSIFISWLVSLCLLLKNFVLEKKKLTSVLALVGIFVLIALPAEGFSIDSFALPFFWISLGLSTTILRVKNNSNAEKAI